MTENQTPENVAPATSTTDTATTPAVSETPAAPEAQASQTPVATVTAAKPAKPNRGFAHGLGLGAGVGGGFAAVLSVGSIISSLILGVFFVIAMVTPAGSIDKTEVIWGKEDATKSIRAFSITGTILGDESEGNLFQTGTYGYEIAAELDKLTAEDSSGVLLLINTPGGTIHGSFAISDAVARYQERTGQKVATYVQGQSASGGMLAMANSDVIYADKGSNVGSIGVILGPISQYKGVTAVDGGMVDGGVTAAEITSEYFTKGDGKAIGDPYKELTAADRKMLDDLISGPYDQFVKLVSESRGIPEATIKNEFGAHIFNATDAVANGLIDAELGRVDAFRRIATDFGLDPDDVKIEAASEPGFLAALMGASTRIPGTATAAESTSTLAASVCGAGTPLVFAGTQASVCG